jgi:proteasome lid subunit RPN8/RPN11
VEYRIFKVHIHVGRSIHELASLYTGEMVRTVRSRRKVFGQLLKHARLQPHRECCGILAGQDDVITRAFPAKNIAADPVRYYMIAPEDLVLLMGELRQRRLEFRGIYHSHPHWMDRNEPSSKDIAWACLSEAIHFIVSPRPYAVTPVRAFSIRDGRATELEIQILP